jgi:ABC-type phosphate transport system substrate-binding protein
MNWRLKMKSVRIAQSIAVIALSVLVLLPGAAGAQISVIVAASSSHSADESLIADMFSGAQTTWQNGARVQVVDQPDTDVGQTFYGDFLGQSVAQLRTQWTRLVLSGQALAPIKAGDALAVIARVRENPERIGYIPTAALDDSVKELIRIQ